MKKVTLSLDSSLKEIFTYEESRAVFDKFLPGMRTMAESQPAALGFSVRKIIQFSGGLVIGTVESVRTGDDGLAQYAVLAPAARLGELSEVFIIKDFDIVD